MKSVSFASFCVLLLAITSVNANLENYEIGGRPRRSVFGSKAIDCSTPGGQGDVCACFENGKVIIRDISDVKPSRVGSNRRVFSDVLSPRSGGTIGRGSPVLGNSNVHNIGK